MINLETTLLDKVNPQELFLLCHIAKRMGRELTCFPCMDTLIKDTGFSRNTLKKHRKSLLEKDLIEMSYRNTKSGKQGSNLYQIKTPLIGVFVTLKHIENLKNNSENLGGQKLPPQPTEVSKVDILGGSKVGRGRGSTFNPLSINHNKYLTPSNKGDENQKLTKGETILNRIEEIRKEVKDFWRANEGHKAAIISAAYFTGDFFAEVDKWISHNSTNHQFLKDPYSFIGKFQNWLFKAKQFQKNGNTNSTNSASSNPGGQITDMETVTAILQEID